MRMKKLLTFLTLLTLFFGVGWAETVTLTQSNLGLTGSYTTNTQKTIDGITFVYTDLMKNNDNIQAKASSGEIHNSTAFSGNITSVAISHSGTARETTILGSSDGSNWTQVATGSGSVTGDFSGKGYKYFKITRGSNAAYWTKIEITYTNGGSQTTEYDVTCNSAEHGSISVGSTTSYAEGATVTVTATPADGYKLSTVTVTPTESGVTAPTATISGNTATFTMPASDVTVVATFAPITYVQYKLVEKASDLVAGAEYILVGSTNSAPYSGILGSISGNIGSVITTGLYYDSSEKTITIEDNSSVTPLKLGGSNNAWTFHNGTGYLSYTGSNNTLSTANDASSKTSQWIIYADAMPSSNILIANCNSTSRYINYNSTTNPKRFACYTGSGLQSPVALFKKVEVGAHSITIDDAIENGTVTSNKASANSGDQVTLTVTPVAGYELTALSYNGTAITPLTGGSDQSTYTFTMPDADVTITATFSPRRYKVDYTQTTGGKDNGDHGVLLISGTTYNDQLGYSTAEYNSEVVFKVCPEYGYQINTVTVTTAGGSTVTATQGETNSNHNYYGTYYTIAHMPADAVTIAVTFKQGDIYIIGTANDNAWDGNTGVLMTYNATPNTYTARVYFKGDSEASGEVLGYGRFSFAEHLSGENGSWSNMGARYGANNNNEDPTSGTHNWTRNDSNPYAFMVEAGIYDITVNWGTGQVSATKVEPEVTLNKPSGALETGTTVTVTSNLTQLLSAIKSGVSATLAYSTDDGTSYTDGSSFPVNQAMTAKGKAYYGKIEAESDSYAYTVVTHYAISCSANPTKGGSVKAYIGEDQVTSAIAGDVITLDVTTKNGYEISSVTLNGDELEAVNGVYSFTMPAEAAVVVANFAAKTLNLNVVNDNSKGTVAGIPATSTVGSPINFTVTPHSGYSVASVTYSFTPDGGEQNTQTLTATNGAYKFNMPGYDVTISVTYNEHSSGGTGSGDFTLVTSTDDLIAGREYIIVCQNVTNGNNSYGPYALSAPNAGTSTAQSNARAGVNDIELSNDNTICTAGSAEIFQLEGSEGAWKFHSSNGYLFGTSGQNYLNIGDEYADNWEVASINIQSGSVAKIQFNNDSRWIQCNNNSITATNGNVPYFACYSSNQKQVYLYYREVGLSDPVFTPAAGIYDIDVDVTIDCSTSGATIYYTTDGSEPSATNGTEYTGEIVVSETTTFKAIAIKDSEVSNVVTATYTISKSSTVETVFPTYSEPFTSGIGKFHVENGDGFSPVWTLDGNYGVKGTAYSNGTNYAATSRLISPIIDLSDASVPELTFSHQINSYFTDPTTQCQLFIRETTNGTSGTWVELDGLSFTTPASGTWSNDFADIDLSDYVGKKIQISFLYTNPTEGSGAGTWEIQNFVVADNSEYKMVNNIAEFLALENGTKAKFKNPVTVLYDYAQNSSSTYQEYIWFKDASGYCQFYLRPTLNSTYDEDTETYTYSTRAKYENGDIIPAGFVVTKNYYENGGFNQAASNDALNAGFLRSEEKGLADPEFISLDDLDQLNANDAADLARWCNHYVTVEKIRILVKDTNFGNNHNNKAFGFCDADDPTATQCSTWGYNKYSDEGSLKKDGTSAVVEVPEPSATTFYNMKAILQIYKSGSTNYWELMPIEFTEWKEEEMTLRTLCQDGVVNHDYKISNNLLGVYSYYDETLDADILWVKDDNGQSIHMVSPEAPYTDNFAIEFEDLKDGNDNIVIPANTRLEQQYYDQSNWCQLILTGKNGKDFEGKIINGGAIEGRFTDKLNPTLEGVTLTAADIYSTSSYAPNYYVPASFVGNQSCNTDMYGEEGHGDFFFMTPKPQEFATIVWAVWDGQKMNMPTRQDGNSHDLFGEFSIDLSMNQNHVTAIPVGAYSFHAIIRKVNTAGAPALKGKGDIQNNQSASYMVYPLDIDPDNNPSTGINTVQVGNGEIKSVKYVNVAGIVSDRPFQGVNIVVTEYTDGSRSTSKMIKR